ncbi:MAG: ParB/RepB/Spo0J family partition protein, partial [Microbacteriaceae bacterium]
MTTTATATTDLLDQPEGLIRIPTDKLLPNPDNIRNDDEPSPDLVRSVTERGVLIPPIVLPANPDGSHYLVAGHRRRKAAIVAGRDYIDCLERDLTPIEVLDTMILENEARANLSALESIRAVARYQHLDPKASATKIGKRLGHTATWVKQRWAVAALPDAVVADLGHGVSLVQLAALAPVVEHGDDTVTACYTSLARNWRFREDPATAVDQWLARHLGEQALAAKTAELTAAGMTVVTDRPNGAVPLKGEHGSLGMTTEQARAHRHEECHTVRLVLDHASRIVATHYCTRPDRHVTRDDTPADSAITVPADQLPAPAPKPGTANPQNQLDKQRRQARDARLEAAGRAIGGKGRLPKNDTLHLAAAILLHS